MALIALLPTSPDPALLEAIEEPRLKDAIQRQWQVEESLKIQFGRHQPDSNLERTEKKMAASTRQLCRQLRKYGLSKPEVEHTNGERLTNYQQLQAEYS
mmetsp:Transcript_36651/g.113431  ORF Transcript_36651/g.113431 Transcript_36651/m.113431 type:complete len:99 (-) Transcript_36651:1276-1572(-)